MDWIRWLMAEMKIKRKHMSPMQIRWIRWSPSSMHPSDQAPGTLAKHRMCINIIHETIKAYRDYHASFILTCIRCLLDWE
jgi:hypothetical protein